jgi:hypothetical protein
MKCASALAAMTVIVFGTPAIALASTAGSGPGSGSGYGPPGQVTIACPPVNIGRFKRTKLKGILFPAPGKPGPGTYVPGPGKPGKVVFVRPGKRVHFRISCSFRPRGCPRKAVTFDLASGSSTLTEVSGPVLAPPEEFTYDGSTYTIMTVNPGADSFTVFQNGSLFVNSGPAITDGTGLLACSG